MGGVGERAVRLCIVTVPWAGSLWEVDRGREALQRSPRVRQLAATGHCGLVDWAYRSRQSAAGAGITPGAMDACSVDSGDGRSREIGVGEIGVGEIGVGEIGVGRDRRW